MSIKRPSVQEFKSRAERFRVRAVELRNKGEIDKAHGFDEAATMADAAADKLAAQGKAHSRLIQNSDQ